MLRNKRNKKELVGSKKNMQSKVTKLRKDTGITLVALVITIIVIIILATVAINMAFGDNGLITRAQEAKEITENSVEYESGAMANLTAYMEENFSELVPPLEQEPTPIADLIGKGEPQKNTTKVVDDSTDGEEEIFYIPGGFQLGGLNAEGELEVTTEVDEGIVITDGTNEFVWVPVDSTSLAEMYQTESTDTVTLPVTLSRSSLNEEETTTNVYSNLRGTTSGASYTAGVPGSTNAREPDILISTEGGDASTTANRGINLLKSELEYTGTNEEILKKFAQDMVNEYTATYGSIARYGGFYIGRYELTETEGKPTVKRNQPVLTAANENYTTWYGLKKACSEVVTDSKYAQSEMIYGNQWDEVMDWLKQTEFAGEEEKVDEDSSKWGNYSDYNTGNSYEEGNEKYIAEAGTQQESGFSDYWSANNIYDLAGNYWDYTQEAIRHLQSNSSSEAIAAIPVLPSRLPTVTTAAIRIISIGGDSARVALYIK